MSLRESLISIALRAHTVLDGPTAEIAEIVAGEAGGRAVAADVADAVADAAGAEAMEDTAGVEEEDIKFFSTCFHG